MTALTDQEAQALFNATSKAIRDDDSEKLASLADAPPPIENKEEIEPVIVTPPEKLEEDKNKEIPPVEEKLPENKEEVVNEETPPVEKTELEKLQEQLAAISKENHALRSQAGRVPHVQRRLQELDKKLEELNKAQASPSRQPSTKIVPKVEEILKGIKETDPDLAAAVAKAIAEATDGVAEETFSRELTSTQAAHAEATREYQEAEVSRLLEMYPNAGEVFKSPSFVEWKGKQSPGVQKLVGSDNADDVSVAFEKYAQDMVKLHPELATKEQPAPVVDDTAARAAAEKAKQVETERQRKKETAAVVGSSNAQGSVAMPDDAEALFKKFSETIRKDRLG